MKVSLIQFRLANTFRVGNVNDIALCSKYTSVKNTSSNPCSNTFCGRNLTRFIVLLQKYQ